MPDDPTYFTVEEANRTLPLVERIVRDIVAAHAALEQRQRAFHELADNASDPDVAAQLETLREEMAAGVDHVNGFIEELQQIGCAFKGADGGLVDFPSHHGDRTILLCWKLGEASIRFWHEVDGGYAGRRPVTRSMFGS